MAKQQFVGLGLGCVCLFPKDRPYTEFEALGCLAIDYLRGNAVTVAGYANLWQWSCGRVKRFLNRAGLEIVYPEDTAKKQNQRGQISVQITNRSPEKNGQMLFYDFRNIACEANRSQEKNEQITNRSANTTIKNIKNKNKNKERESSKPDPASSRNGKKSKNVKPEIPYLEIVGHLNELTGSEFLPYSKLTVNLINRWYSEGFTLEDFKTVIDAKVFQWNNEPEFKKYLRPSTLFGSKFEEYLNEAKVKRSETKNNYADYELEPGRLKGESWGAWQMRLKSEQEAAKNRVDPTQLKQG